MQLKRPRHATVVAYVALFAALSGTAVAATGNAFVLGRANNASTTTYLSNSGGTALAVGSKAGTPPLAVSNSVKVPRLNVDLVDGMDSSAFARTAGRTANLSAEGQPVDLDGDAVNDVLLAIATCPVGSVLTGGGNDNVSSGVTFVDSPSADNRSWSVASTFNAATDTGSDLVAYAVCYSPTGAVSMMASPRRVSASTWAETVAKARARQRS
jgi:hypothetical protein